MYLTPDMMEKLRPQAQAVQINAMQFLGQPSAGVLAKTGGLHAFVGMPRWPMLATNRDATLQEYGIGKPSNNSGCYVLTHSGGQMVTAERYMGVIDALRPELFVAMADEVLADASRKRVALSVDRTAKWLDECIERLQAMQKRQAAAVEGASQQQPEPQQEAASTSGRDAGAAAEQPAKRRRRDGCGIDAAGGPPDEVPLLLAPVMGGASVEERARAAKGVADKPVAGFALSGFGMGEDAALLPELLAAAVEHLPPGKPRLLLGMASPEEALEGVLHGADLLDCSYPTHATANGYALCFPLRMPGEGDRGGDEPPGAGAGEGADDSKLNLWAQHYRLDRRPLVEGCGCFACASHTRAYIHHLLHAHEMLASVLLEAHNTHWWLAFFGEMRAAIEAGRLRDYAAWFKARRRAARGLSEAAGDAEAAPAPA